MNNLCRVGDIKLSLPIGSKYPDSAIEQSIELIEFNIFDNCALGITFYELLKSKLSPVPEFIEKYNPTQTYAIGNKVLYYNIIIESLTNSNTGTMNTTTQNANWKQVDKFLSTETNYNLVWPFMRKWIALNVYADSLVDATFKADDKGLTKYSEDFRGQGTGIMTVAKEDFSYIQRVQKDKAAKAYSNLVTMLKRLNIYPDGVNESDLNDSVKNGRKGTRRIFLKTQNK